MKTRKIVIACDSFKGSLSSMAVGEACRDGVRLAAADFGTRIDADVVPVGDGGEGTAEALMEALGASQRCVSVSGPLGDTFQAIYGFAPENGTAVMEMASASGITLVQPERRNAMAASSYGTGQMIADALNAGCREILIGIGGSATTDGGMGMLQALGYRFYDANGSLLDGCGANLAKVAHIDFSEVDKRLRDVRFTAACDVNNPLCGPEGSAAVFGPQKGATPQMVEALDAGMRNYAHVAARSLGYDKQNEAGSGAAGGLGFAFRAFLGARLVPGIKMVLDAVGFDDRLNGADLVITGEGRLDHQTAMGKTPAGVLRAARERGVPVVAIGGSVVPGTDFAQAGFAAVFPIVQGPCTLEEAMDPDNAAENIRRTVLQLVHAVNL